MNAQQIPTPVGGGAGSPLAKTPSEDTSANAPEVDFSLWSLFNSEQRASCTHAINIRLCAAMAHVFQDSLVLSMTWWGWLFG